MIEKHNLKAEECLFIDDKEHNLFGAHKIGMEPIQFNDNKQLEKTKAEEKTLKTLQKKLETKTRAKRQPKPKTTKQSNQEGNLDQIKPRLPY